MPNSSAWLMAGNSRHALTEPTRGSGPFESHLNGHFLMKELKTPWVNWHSPLATVSTSVLSAQGLDDHPWVQHLEPGGAYTLQDDNAMPAMERWTRVRIAEMLAGSSKETPRRMLEQLLDTTVINLTSSDTSSSAAVSGSVSTVGLPPTFFVDSELLGILGLDWLAVQTDVAYHVGEVLRHGELRPDEIVVRASCSRSGMPMACWRRSR